jgi:putative membrane protein
MIRRFLVRWVSNFVAVMLAGYLFEAQIQLQERGSDAYWMTLAAFAAVLAVLQLYVRPIVYAVMGPITCLVMVVTLGLAHFLTGAVLFWLAGSFVDGIEVENFLYAMAGAAVVAVVGMAGSIFLGSKVR